MKNRVLITITILLAFLAGGELTYLLFGNNISKKENGSEESMVYNSCTNCMSGTMVIENGGIKETVSKVYDAVVMVKNKKNKTDNGSGSGFVYKTDSEYGYILTNHHVIDGATDITIVNASNEEVKAELLGKDKYLDVAVLRIPKKKVIAVAKIGSSEKVELGETIVAIGTPVDEEYYNSVTGGYISGLNRKVTVDVDSKNDWVQDVIQIDAPINPGNSGGALVNINGEVIGITSLKFINEKVEGMGFAIKIDDVMKHIDELENGKTIERPFIGITYANTTDTLILQRYKIELDESIDHGIVVLDTTKDSAADKAGIKAGDVIVKIDKEEVKNVAHLKYLLYKHKVGDKIKMTYIRGTSETEVELSLTEKKEE
jgi:serine protease Do